MSLYGDLPPPTQNGTSEQEEKNELLSQAQASASSKGQTKSALPAGWASASLRFVPPIQRKPTVQAKPKLTPRAPATSPPGSVAAQTDKASSSPAAAVPRASSSKNKQQQQQPNLLEDVNQSKLNIRSNRAAARNLFDKNKKGVKGVRQAPLSLEDDYDPTKPNDYEEYKELEKRRREEEALSQAEKRFRSPSYDGEKRASPRYFPPPSLYSSESSPSSKTSDLVEDTVIERQPPAHIDLDISGEEAFLRRARLSNHNNVVSRDVISPRKSPEHRSTSGLGSEDFAHRMLAKYGWQEGQGLGKSEQGISEPLMVQKTDYRSGKTEGMNISNIGNYSKNYQTKEELSRVILLTNMVGPGEVDDTLQEETADECNEKYGTVERCLIFEVPHGKLPDDEAVRIFVKFVEQEAATKAKMDLNGRFFGGRAVTARFFDQSRFDKLDLAPSAAELQKARQRDNIGELK
ncbi:2079_t:CDS:2 [Ambispora gerdemannii]|uniref:2079_t:CDS:1 n=1 Tax=Ambispora gerdemannii TaxID=144530 RepID=A0A9N9BS85_9GLOM|nr:2079_t:CDS:2 [Ambispora gerdemannii]